MRKRVIPPYHSIAYHIKPDDLYRQIAFCLGLNQVCEYYLSQMDYGDYMDKDDGLGYDDIEPYNYGYNDALSGIMSAISNILGTVGRSVGSVAGHIGGVAKSIYGFSSRNIAKGLNVAGRWSKQAVKFVRTKVPAIGRTAYAKVILPTYKKVLKPAYTKFVRPIGKASLQVVKNVIVGGLKVGAWVISTTGEVFYADTSGRRAVPPAGESPPAHVQQPYGTAPTGQETMYPPTDFEYVNGTPIDVSSGWVYDEATGQPIRQATEEEIEIIQEKRKIPWGLIVGGIATALMVL